MSKFDSDEFKALQKIWYDKLAATPDKQGALFDDIEDTSRADKPLKSWHNHKFKSIDVEQRLATESYYEQANLLLSYYRFKNKTHKRIWELHCKGLSRRKIAVAIEDMTPTYGQARIGEIILEIAKTIKGESKCHKNTTRNTT